MYILDTEKWVDSSFTQRKLLLFLECDFNRRYTIHLIDFRRANEPELVSNERWHPERNLNEKK
jgi:hypothetical protein